ncbi:MAG: hypothetical protein LBP51_00090 [Deferribacteraceae bacterium]|nr:hypothetical protein [Deferribacteraceae bacterium]
MRIFDTAYGAGGGVGRLESGKTVFVPYTVTGDAVEIEIASEKKSFCFGRLLRVITPSPFRVEADCPYFTICGGCFYRHIDYVYQLEIKRNILKHFLKLKDIQTISGEADFSRLRCTMRAHEGRIGFYKLNSRELVPITSCKMLTPSLFNALIAFAAGDGFNRCSFCISALETPRGILAEVKGGSLPFPKSCAPFEGIKVHRQLKGNPSKFRGVALGKQALAYPLKYGDVSASFGSFFQANRSLLETFQEAASKSAYGNIVELYAGSGFFTSALQRLGKLTAVEADKTAAELGRQSGFPIETGDALSFLKKIRTHAADTIFLDPPRRGLEREVLTEIVRINPKHIIYVSCDPATLARDAAILLEKGWRISGASLIDLFPHTQHIESITFLDRD